MAFTPHPSAHPTGAPLRVSLLDHKAHKAWAARTWSPVTSESGHQTHGNNEERQGEGPGTPPRFPELCKPQRSLYPRVVEVGADWAVSSAPGPAPGAREPALCMSCSCSADRPHLETRGSKNPDNRHSSLPGPGARVFSVLGTAATPASNAHKSLSPLQTKWGQPRDKTSDSKTESWVVH